MAIGNALELTCDWCGSLNVTAGGRGPYGYLLAWSGLGGLILAKDLVVWNPLGSGGPAPLDGPTIACVGIVERFAFGGDDGDPIEMSCFVSKENQANLRSKLGRDLPNVKVRTAWKIVDYDRSAKAWYSAVDLRQPGQLDAMVHTEDGELQIAIDPEPTPVAETRGVDVYRFSLTLAPPPRRSVEIQLTLGQSQHLVRAWAAKGGG